MTNQIWEIDSSHSSVAFHVKHMMIAKVHGTFSQFSGKISYNEADIKKSSADATIQVASIDTREPKRDEHLRSADFFDAQNFPQMTFVSKKIEGGSKEAFTLVGDLALRGVTKEVKLAVELAGAPVKDPWGNLRLGASAQTKINRKDFGLHWNAALEAGGVLVGDEVTIQLDLQFVKK